jgi:hypothetical protein
LTHQSHDERHLGRLDRAVLCGIAFAVHTTVRSFSSHRAYDSPQLVVRDPQRGIDQGRIGVRRE